MGALPRNQQQTSKILGAYDLLIVLSSDPVRMSVHSASTSLCLTEFRSSRSAWWTTIWRRISPLRSRSRQTARGNLARARSRHRNPQEGLFGEARLRIASGNPQASKLVSEPRELVRENFAKERGPFRSTPIGSRCRSSTRFLERDLGRRRADLVPAHVRFAGSPRPLRLLPSDGVRRHRLGSASLCRRTSLANPDRASRLLFGETAVPCTRSNRFGPPRITICR